MGKAMIEDCIKRGLEYRQIDEEEPFRFGPGNRIWSKYALLLPVIWDKETFILRISIVEKDIPCLMS